MNWRADQTGLTIVELLLSISIATIISVVLLSIGLMYYADTLRSNQAAELDIEAHYAMRAVIEDIRLASAIASTNSLADANQPSGGWHTSDAQNVLVINSPAIDAGHNIIYDPETAYPYENEYIYYLNNRALRKRTLKNDQAPANAAITSCPTTSSSCPADKTYSTSVDNFSLTFYNQNNTATADPTLARSVKLSLTASRQTFGRKVSFSNTLQTTLRNY